MTDEEIKAIDQLKYLNSIIFYNTYKNYFEDNMGEIDRHIKVLLNLIEKQEKVIDTMAKNIENEIGISSKFAFVDLLEFENVEEIKEYFYRKVENNEQKNISI